MQKQLVESIVDSGQKKKLKSSLESSETEKCKYKKECDFKNEKLKQKEKQMESIKLKNDKHLIEEKSLNENLQNKLDNRQKKSNHVTGERDDKQKEIKNKNSLIKKLESDKRKSTKK